MAKRKQPLRRDTRAFLFGLALAVGPIVATALCDLATARLAPQPEVGPPAPESMRELRGRLLGIRWRAGSARGDAP